MVIFLHFQNHLNEALLNTEFSSFKIDLINYSIFFISPTYQGIFCSPSSQVKLDTKSQMSGDEGTGKEFQI